MAIKKPLVLYDGKSKELQSGDTLPLSPTLLLQETVPTTVPPVGYMYIYVKANGQLYKMDENGSEELVQIDISADFYHLKDVVCTLITELMSLGIPFDSYKLINFLNS